jgi:hypothetical protein
MMKVNIGESSWADKKTIMENGGKRDAFHVPGILVTSDQVLCAGDRVAFTDSSFSVVRRVLLGETPEAIVDPFLKSAITCSDFESTDRQLFWVFMMPGMTKNLTHHFEIVDVDNPPEPISEPESEDEDVWDTCRGCYDDEPEEDDYDGCKGCYE